MWVMALFRCYGPLYFIERGMGGRSWRPHVAGNHSGYAIRGF